MKNILLSTVAVHCLAASVAIATLPDDQIVYFEIRENPSDEQSAVILEVALDVSAIETVGNQAKWDVTEARFVEIDSNGMEGDSWTKTSPTLSTSDGYWWVTHNDFVNPAPSEFNVPPSMNGTAAADVSGDNLDYEVDTGSLTGSEVAMYNGDVGGMTHTFTLSSEEEPKAEGENEPVRVTKENPPPMG